MRRLPIRSEPDWPGFRWDRHRLAATLAAVRHQQGRFVGRVEALAFPLRQEAILITLTEDVVASSEMDGEPLDLDGVYESVARRLGMNAGRRSASHPGVEGPVELLVDATRRYDEPISAERLQSWHSLLCPGGRGGPGPMAGDDDLRAFVHWFEDGGGAERDLDPVLKAGLALLWFLTIHPFDAGTGRIARAIADLTLARSERSPRRFYSLSAQIRLERAACDDLLERTWQGPLDVTPWLEWFLGCLGRAIDRAPVTLARVLAKARFRRAHQDLQLNERQRRMIDHLLDGAQGTEGALTTSVWAALAKCSHDTALRDVAELVARGVMARSPAGGRSTRYALRLR